MPPSATHDTPAACVAACAPTYRAGTLVYTRGRLQAVFAWLLAGEVVFTLVDMLEPKLLPVLLKLHGATDTQIAVIIGSFNAALQFLIMPPAGYFSDRLRTRWGRRVPLLLIATPFATLFLALTPFAPELAAWMQHTGLGDGWLKALPLAPTVAVFAVLVLLFRSAQTVTNVAFFGLVRDVVPDSHMGRFLGLFRLFGAGGMFILAYWLLGYAETHSRPIFVGVAVLNLVGFAAVCWFVREGAYPPAAIGAPAPRPGGRLASAWRTFLRESYRHPVYLWTYFVRVCIYAALLGLSGFLVFFYQRELGMTLPAVGAMLAWPSLAWVVLAYPVGRLVDRWGAIPVLKLGLAVISLGYTVSFVAVVGPRTFFVSSMVTGVAFWVVMLTQLKLTQEIFHPQRYSQLAGANTALQSIVIAVCVSPLAGWLLDALRDCHRVVELPWAGPVEFGPYRMVNLMLAFVYALALLGVQRVRHHWIARGGPEGYVPPL